MSPARIAGCLAATLSAAAAVGCTSSSTAPSTSSPTPRPTVVVASMSVGGASTTHGFEYQTVVHLKETAGVPATIVSVDLSFIANGTTLVSSHHEQPISDGANVCPASGTIATRTLTTSDTAPSDAYATTVRATVTYTDGTAYAASAVGTADVPPLAVSPPHTYSLTGVITDATTHAGISGARLEAINGANAGNATTTDTTGTYVLTNLVAETFRLRASANGYGTGEQNVTIPENVRADFQLQRVDQTPCAYVVAPSTSGVISWEAKVYDVAVTRTSGTCGWQASADATWITFPDGASGSGTGTLRFAVGANGFDGRSGTIVVAWAGGSASIGVTQGPHPDFTCNPFAMSKGPQDFDNVPAAGGTLTVNAAATANPPEWSSMCAVGVSSTVAWISGGATVSGPVTLTFTVAPNPSPGVSRTGAIAGGGITISVTQR